MRGAPLAKAIELIRASLHHLRPDDTFQIVRFDDTASALGAGPIANKPRNIQLVLDWLAKLEAAGGTEMATGIEAALAVPHDPHRLRIVALLTDGYIGNEDAMAELVRKRMGDARVFAFGVGTAVNRYLLDELAAAGRGVAQYVRPDEDTLAAIAAFERRIDTPVLTDLRVDWGGLAIADVSPQAIPDLFAGQPLVLAGHYTQPGTGTVKIRGKQAGRDVAFDVPVTLPDREPARPAIRTVWARQRIAELSRKLVRANDPKLVAEITQLSLAHHLLTQFTAFVAVDESRTTAGGAAKKIVVPVEIPDAMQVSAGGTGGTGRYATIGYARTMGSGYGYVSAPRVTMRDRYVVTPTVLIGQPVANGDLDKSIIRRYIKRYFAKIQYCYEKELLARPKLGEGTVSIKFMIDNRGLVIASEASGFDATVGACVAAVMKEIEFPMARGGGNVEVNYPFTFRVPEASTRASEEPIHVIP
jgi:Ca-activated chloride channel homolog